MATTNIERQVDQARDATHEAPQIVASKAQSALESVNQMGIVQHYVFPPAGYLKNLYVQAPTSVKIGVVGFGVISAFPLGCFMGFMGFVTLGSLIVGFAIFSLVFLLPALGVSLLVACGVGLVSMVAYVGYLLSCAVLSMIWGHGDLRKAKRQIREAKQRANKGGRRANG
ncbi:hypothetical protein KI688_012304 [Linnemannia hyalina]|uniref:Uncharacterized protein n=1 Tax=Linnemannia hyalina TaxID=64524 RepID=A0A9P7XUR5_9FUNG|nr:hypothetical protein KI688_012304 [Linnemannia hyalina]